MAAGDILLVEHLAGGIFHGSCNLVFIGHADVYIAMNAFQVLGLDEELFLAEAFFGGIGGVVAEPPEIIGIITIGGLETDDVVFVGEENRGGQREDQLGAEGVEAQHIHVRGPDGRVVSRAEETGGDTAKAPFGLQGPYDEGEGEEVFMAIAGAQHFFAGDSVDGKAFLLPGRCGYGKTA